MARGYIRKRGDRSWQLTFDAPRGPDGRRNQRYETVQGTKRQAEARLTQILESLRRGHYLEPTNLTVGEFLDQFLVDYAEMNCRPRTVQGYRDIIRVHLKPSLGYVPLARLSAQDIQRYYALKVRGGLSAQTVKHHHTLLHRALEIAITWELLERNPSDRIVSPTPGPSPAKALGLEEVRRLLVTSQPTAYHLPVHLAIYAGLRRGEILGLRWEDVDIDARTLSIRRTLVYTPGRGCFYGEPKSRGSNRTLHVPQVTAVLLRSNRDRMQVEYENRRLACGLDQVCAFPDGRMMKPDALSHAFQNLVRQCGLGKTRFHDLRHTHASLLLGDGAQMNVVQSRMGHESIMTTVDIYGHVLADADMAAANALERLISLDVGVMWAADDLNS